MLRPDATQEDIERVAMEAVEYRFFGACVEARWLSILVPRLSGTGVKAVTVVSFPGGQGGSDQKAREAAEAVEAGADEVDMVIDRRWLHQRRHAQALEDVANVVRACGRVPVKVILEMSELSEVEKVMGATFSVAAGAAFVKTSTGFSKSGATVADVRLLRDCVGERVGVKASGGIRTLADAIQMIEAGASRLGMSASVAIAKEWENQFGS